MWKKAGEEGHIRSPARRDATAELIKDGYVSATACRTLLRGRKRDERDLAAIDAGESQPNQVIADPGFALTQSNLAEREMDIGGCVLLSGAS